MAAAAAAAAAAESAVYGSSAAAEKIFAVLAVFVTVLTVFVAVLREGIVVAFFVTLQKRDNNSFSLFCNVAKNATTIPSSLYHWYRDSVLAQGKGAEEFLESAAPIF